MKYLNLPKYFLLKDKFINENISFLRKLVITRDKEIAINFSELQDCTRGALMVFMAQIEKTVFSFGKKIYRHGKFPSSQRMKKILISSGNILHQNTLITPIILSDAEKRASLVNPNLIDSIVVDLKKIGVKDYYYPFNTFLTEIIANAVEHGIEKRKINWWLTQDIDKGKKHITYSFVDMGDGIIDTHKKAKLPLKYWFMSDSRIVLDALYGKLGSSTKQTNRGRGLPQLRNLIELGIVSDLIIITNRVSLSYQDNCFKSAKNPNFVGTYYSWTINKDNCDKWKNTQ